MRRSPSRWCSGRSTRAGGWPARSTTASASGSSACSSICPLPLTRFPATRQWQRSRWPGHRTWPAPHSTRRARRSRDCALGLVASLESLGYSFPQFDVQVEAAQSRLPEHLETALYRTAQEALQNVAKHASAKSARIRLSVAADRVLLEISDDGDGFDVTAAVRSTGPAAPTGFGLPGMRERAELLGGRLTLSSVPGRGTTVRLALPLSPSAQ